VVPIWVCRQTGEYASRIGKSRADSVKMIAGVNGVVG
jgi:hypothetical protein